MTGMIENTAAHARVGRIPRRPSRPTPSPAGALDLSASSSGVVTDSINWGKFEVRGTTDRRQPVPNKRRQTRYIAWMARASFDLQSPFQPAGDQPKAIAELSAGLARG